MVPKEPHCSFLQWQICVPQEHCQKWMCIQNPCWVMLHQRHSPGLFAPSHHRRLEWRLNCVTVAVAHELFCPGTWQMEFRKLFFVPFGSAASVQTWKMRSSLSCKTCKQKREGEKTTLQIQKDFPQGSIAHVLGHQFVPCFMPPQTWRVCPVHMCAQSATWGSHHLQGVDDGIGRHRVQATGGLVQIRLLQKGGPSFSPPPRDRWERRVQIVDCRPFARNVGGVDLGQYWNKISVRSGILICDLWFWGWP